MRFRFLLFVALPVSASAVAEAQRPRIEIILPAQHFAATEPPRVRSEGLLVDARIHDLLVNGFPARLHYTIERWAVKRWFDGLRATGEWTMVVRHDPLDRVFRVYDVRGDAAALVGAFTTLTGADSAVGRMLRAPITPPHPGERSYYAARVDVEMLSVSDLDELERWLRGELRPAVRGDRRPATVIERTTRTFLVRVLGGERRRYTARSGSFVP